MADSDDLELEQARKRVRSFEKKSDSLRNNGSNLSSNGKEDKAAAKNPFFDGGPSPGRDAATARKSLSGGVRINPTPNNSPKGGDEHITGQVGGLERGKPKSQNWKDLSVGSDQQKEAIVRPSKLFLPVVRPKRISNQDGATSFHFSHEAISKTKYAKETASGTKNRKGAAKDHARYIERDGAVARAEEDDLEKIEKELRNLALNDPELAKQLGLDQDEINNNPDSDKSVAEKIAGTMSVGAMAGVYIEREEALAHDDNGTAVLFTNISEDPKERRDFWEEVEKREANPSDDVLRLTLRGNEDFWQKVSEDKDCPKKLRDAVKNADPNKEVAVRTEDNEVIRRLMKKHGWRPREKRPSEETDEQRFAREEREAATSFGAQFEDGRGGRVQFRVVGELPYDVDHQARIRILKGFAEEFEKRNLPYIAVMHSPDHTNDDRNWHFHLVYHDRPVSRFTGRAEDHMWELPEHAGTKLQRQHEILQSTLGSEELQQHAGKWDFMVPWKYKKPVSRNIMTTYPFTQEKNREVTRRPFIPALRKVLSELTNRELEASGKSRRLDPRTYSEMGINKKPDVHLGTQAARLESVGVPTEAGTINEQNQWDYVQQSLKEDRIRDERNIDNALRKWDARISASDVTENEKEKLTKAMILWEQEMRKANEHAAIAKNLTEHYERLESRAKKIQRMAQKHLTAIENNRATARQIRDRERYEDKLKEANAHLAGLKIFMAEEFMQISLSQQHAKRHNDASEVQHTIIENIISDGMARRKLKEGEAKSRPAKTEQKASSQKNQDQKKSDQKNPVDADRLSKSDVDNYVRKVMKSNIRVVEENGIFVPKIKSAYDIKMIGAKGYDSTQARLGNLKKNHDELVSYLVDGLKRNPRMLAPVKSGEALVFEIDKAAADITKTYRLSSGDKKMQQAWRMFASEPESVAAIAVALKVISDQEKFRNQKSNASKSEAALGLEANKPSSSNNGAKPENPVNAPASTRTTQAPADRNMSSAAQFKKVEAVLTVTREKSLRPKIEKTGNAMTVKFSPQEVALYRLPETITIDDSRTIARMEGIINKNNRGVLRLTKYLEKNPGQVRDKVEEGQSFLKPSAPAELVALAKVHARDPEIKLAIENAVVGARLAALDPRNLAPRNLARENQDKINSADNVPTGKAPASVTSEEKKNDRSGSDNSDNKKTSSRNDSTAPASDLFGGLPVIPSEASKKAEPKAKSGSDETKTPGSREPNNKKTEATEKKTGGLFSLPLDLPEPEISMGAKKLGQSKPVDAEPIRDTEAKKPEKRRGAILPDTVLGVDDNKQPSRSGTRKIEKGINPKIDAWIEAEEKRDRKERERTAAIIRNDRKLLSVIEEFDPVTRAKLQRDWDGVDDRNRRHEQRQQHQQPDKDKKN